MAVGIESFSLYSPCYYLDLKLLAKERGVPAAKYVQGLGQEKMSVLPPDEDIVTMAASAAHQALIDVDVNQIDTLMFATESGIDQSKAAGIYVHQLLDLPNNCRVFELKQACYSGAAGLQFSMPYLIHNPDRKILLIASDVARYGLGTAGEPTQGAGAIAMVLSTNPRIISFERQSGMYTADVMDFWRPNYRDEALVDGKCSIKMYLKTLVESWDEYVRQTNRQFTDFDYCCYHLPFSKMAEKAHRHLTRYAGVHVCDQHVVSQIGDSLVYNRILGNTYAASLFISLSSLLENSVKDVSEKRIGMFSYGSGCVGEFFSGMVMSDYKKYLKFEKHQSLLKDRIELNVAEYEQFYNYLLTNDGNFYETPKCQTGEFRFKGVQDHKRIYRRLDASHRAGKNYH